MIPPCLMQICHEFTRFSTYMPAVKVANFFGGIDIKKNRDELKKTPPQVVVGTPGRIKQVRPGAVLSFKTEYTISCQLISTLLPVCDDLDSP